MIVGGLVAGQGQISLLVLIAIVWTCAVLGDVDLVHARPPARPRVHGQHGARVKITEERLEQVEAFFERRGGMTILIGRFIGLVRAIAPFIAGASRMPLRKFLPYDVLGAGPVGDDVLRPRLRLLALVRPAHRVGRRAGCSRSACSSRWSSRSSSSSGSSAAEELQAKTKAWIAEQLEKPLLRPVAPYLRAGWRRIVRPAARGVRGAGAVRLEPLHAGRPRARGDDAARGRRGRLVRLLPARRRARRARPARRRPGRRSTSPTGSTRAWLVDVAKVVTRARLVRGRRASSSPRRRCGRAVRRRYLDAGVLVARAPATWLAVTRQGRTSTARGRRARSSTRTARLPVRPRRLLRRVGRLRGRARARPAAAGPARFAVVTAAVVIAAAVGLTPRLPARALPLRRRGGLGLGGDDLRAAGASSRWSSGGCVRMGAPA